MLNQYSGKLKKRMLKRRGNDLTGGGLVDYLNCTVLVNAFRVLHLGQSFRATYLRGELELYIGGIPFMNVRKLFA